MDMKKLSSYFATALLVASLGACSGSDSIEENNDPAVVDTRDNTEQSGAQSTGAGSDPSLNGGDLAVSKDDIETVYYFNFDSSGIDADTRAELDKVAQYLSTTSTDVRLNGHADERGTREYNLALSERRANAVRDYLVLQGVAKSRIETIGFGEEKPAQPGSNEGAWSKNRRVELAQ